MALAREMATGLQDNPQIYPAPPVAPEAIKEAVDAFIQADGESVQAHALALAATTAKKAALADLKSKMKQDLRYAEGMTKYDDAQLALIGWGKRRSRSPIAIPGQPQSLQITALGPGSITLKWKKSKIGGKHASYKVQRRIQGEELWDIVEVSVKPILTLKKQPRGKPIEYRVSAFNKSGESTASNQIGVTL